MQGLVGKMVALGAIMSLQIGSSASPVSGTIFVSTLVICLVALAVFGIWSNWRGAATSRGQD